VKGAFKEKNTSIPKARRWGSFNKKESLGIG
jgi:hypothetical protein